MNLNRILNSAMNTTSNIRPMNRILYKYCPLHRSISQRSSSKRLNQIFLENISAKHLQILPKQISICCYSTASSEELARRKHPDTYITVPTLQFEDFSFDQPVTHAELCAELQICNSVEDQMLALTSALSLSPEDVEKRVDYCKKLESLFKPFFGDIKIQMFGSSVNGFGFKGCDIDMSFETFPDKKAEISYLEIPDVPLVTEVTCGKVLPSTLSALPRKEQLLFIHSLLLEFFHQSKEPTIFINAHVPLVRFYHDKYKLKCDLSCRNSVAFANTKLLYLLGKLDRRVIPIMMTIRYWAKHVELIGRGLMFNTYTISLMVIHFLQTRNPPVIPTVEHILSLTDKLEMDDMNDKSFVEVRSNIPFSENTQTLDELLKDFFYYYSFFDTSRVICPFDASAVPRDIFFASQTDKKFKMNTLCVQDPMLFSHNVAEFVDYKHCKKFFGDVLAACRILQNKSNHIPSSSRWGLLTLFDKSNEYLPYLTLSKNISFEIPVITKDVIGGSKGKDRKLLTAETLLYLLNYILFFECKPLEISDALELLKKHDAKLEREIKLTEQEIDNISQFINFYPRYNKKLNALAQEKDIISQRFLLEDFQNLNSKHKIILCAACKATKNTWTGRDLVPLELIPENNLLEREHHISLSAAKQNELNSRDGKTKDFRFLYECYSTSNEPESSLFVNFQLLQKSNINLILEVFLREYVPKVLEDLNRES